MFFFYFNTDLSSELRNFVVDPKLSAVAEKAQRQREEFVARFPLDRLGSLSQNECWDDSPKSNAFVHWITDKTNAVTNQLRGVKGRLGIDKNASKWGSRYRAQQGASCFQAVKRALHPFLLSKGYEALSQAEHYFGQPLLLKILYLYYPENFCNIAHVGWIESITSALALKYGSTIYERSREIRDCLVQESGAENWIGDDYLKDFLCEYLDLKNETGSFVEYLTNERGLSNDIASRYSLSIRQLSRLLYGFGITQGPLFKLPQEKIAGIARDERAIRRLSQNADISWKEDDYQKAIVLFADYIDSLRPRMVSALHGPVQTMFTAGKPREEIVPAKRNVDKEEKVDWYAEFGKVDDAEQAVDILLRSGASRPYYRHYTTFSSFLYITDDWMFRLTRGDDPGMNDQLEWKRLGDSNLWKRTFIASFSCVEGESAAMWGLYGKPSNEALRLSVDSRSMQQWLSELNGKNSIVPQAQFFGINGEPGKKCSLRWQDVHVLFGDILYGGSVCNGKDSTTMYVFRRKELKKSLVKRLGENFERSPQITGFIKSADWSYEDEARLVVRLSKNAKLPEGKSINDVQYVFVPIAKDVLSHVEYMKGPCVTSKLRPIIDEKLQSLFGSATLSDSIYKDNLKFK